MKTNKKMMVSALLIMAVLSIGLTPIFAAPEDRGVQSTQTRQQYMIVNAEAYNIRERIQNTIQVLNAPIDINGLDEADIDKKFEQIDEAPEQPFDTDQRSVLWYLNAWGKSTPLDPVVDAAEPSTRIGLQLLAEKVKVTEYGTLYEVLWGRVTQLGVKVKIMGYAILDSDGVFYMKLKGDRLEFKSIGRIAPAVYGVRVEMKGYMTHSESDYSFQMRGKAIPLNGELIRNRLRNALKPEDPARPPVTPNTETG